MNRRVRHEVPSGAESELRADDRRAELVDFVFDWVVPLVGTALVGVGVWRAAELLSWLDGLL